MSFSRWQKLIAASTRKAVFSLSPGATVGGVTPSV